MEWERIELSIFKNNFEEIGENPDIMGLEINAEKMHDIFLKTSGHLDLVKEQHSKVTMGVSNLIKNDNLSKKATNLNFFSNGKIDNISKLMHKIPIETNFPEGIIIEINNEHNLLRVLFPNMSGGEIKTFSLDDSEKIKDAKWENNLLELTYF